jgi:hypothetical protein
MTRDDWTLCAWFALVLVTAPLWIVPGVIYMIVTGQSPRTLGRKANEASE